jgi:two-component system nitrogen regulation response regulator GlnG
MIILAEDDQKLLGQIKEALKDLKLEAFSKVSDFIASAEKKIPRLAIIDLDFKGQDGLEIFSRLRRTAPHLKTLMLSASNNIELAVKAAKLGAAAFLKKPLNLEELKNEVEKLLTQSAQEHLDLSLPEGRFLLGGSRAISDFIEQAEAETRSDRDILIVRGAGMPGEGIAHLIHLAGPNSHKRFVSINLRSFEKESSESSFFLTLQELLTAPKLSTVIELSSQTGTLYFEGLESIPDHFRKNFLMFLGRRRNEERFSRELKVILAAEKAGPDFKGFAVLDFPKLSERMEDLPAILDGILRANGQADLNLSLKVMKLLSFYDFPGNYEELEALALLAAKTNRLDLKTVPANLKLFLRSELLRLGAENINHLDSARKEFEKDLFALVIAKVNGDLEAAARALDLPRTVLAERLADLGL